MASEPTRRCRGGGGRPEQGEAPGAGEPPGGFGLAEARPAGSGRRPGLREKGEQKGAPQAQALGARRFGETVAVTPRYGAHRGCQSTGGLLGLEGAQCRLRGQDSAHDPNGVDGLHSAGDGRGEELGHGDRSASWEQAGLG